MFERPENAQNSPLTRFPKDKKVKTIPLNDKTEFALKVINHHFVRFFPTKSTSFIVSKYFAFMP